jgi:lysophospholipase L1-like esterase
MERVRALFGNGGPVKWLFYGDSITHGALHTLGWRDYTELFAERVRYEMGRKADIVLNTATSGDDTEALLAGFDWRVGQFRPDVVFVMIGMNDCSDTRVPLDRFEANLHAIAGRVSELGALTVLQTTCLVVPDRSPSCEPHLPRYMEAVRRAAAATGSPLVDHTAYWELNATFLELWMSDGIHPNEYGHRAFARHLFETCGINDPASQTGRLHIP